MRSLAGRNVQMASRFRAELYYLVKDSRQLRQTLIGHQTQVWNMSLCWVRWAHPNLLLSYRVSPWKLKKKKKRQGTISSIWNFPASWPFQLASPFLEAAIIRAIYFAFTSLRKHYIIHSFLCLLNSATCTKFNKALPSVSPAKDPRPYIIINWSSIE